MLLSEFQTTLHALYRGDNSAPTSGSTKYTHRTELLKAAINMWDGQSALWDELFTDLTSASDGTKTVAVSTLQYAMPTDFKRLANYVIVRDGSGQETYFNVVKPHQAEEYEGKQCAYVSGNKKTGYKINFLKQPTVGDTIDYMYYKTLFEPSSASDVIEMSDPYFAVYFALGKLHEQEGAGDRARGAFSMADQKLEQMAVDNESLPYYQENKVLGLSYGNFGGTGSRGLSRYGASLS